MQQSQFHTAVFIGRFQPFHIGHLHAFNIALEQAEQLIVLIGSSGSARTLRNPFTYKERAAMMQASLPPNMRQRVIIRPLQDFTYDDAAWVAAVTNIVTETVNNPNHSIALAGHDKDETTYYLKLFPNWGSIAIHNLDGINATAVRERYFTHDLPTEFNSHILVAETTAWLRDFGRSENFIALAHEYHAIATFKSTWANTPYPVIFTTTDALVRYHDEILLITRKNYPGRGLQALPGGFLNKEETLFDGCLRELSEETQLNVDKSTLKNALVQHKVFDNPKRSTRGRVITYCYYFDLSHLPKRPKAAACDDAATLAWVDLASLDRSQFFEDHFFIINTLLKE